MAATYSVKVRCANCDTHDDIEIPFGTKVGEYMCRVCGCQSLIHIATNKETK